jgi:hypothetical protein
VIGVEAPPKAATACPHRRARHGARRWRLAPLLLIGSWAVVQPTAAASTQTTSLQAQATQLSQELIQEQLQVDVLGHQVELDALRVAQDDAALAVLHQQIVADRTRVREDRLRLSQEAISAYVNAGASTLNPALALFGAGRQSALSRSEYEDVAIGNTGTTLALLHLDEVRLGAAQGALQLRAAQDRAAEAVERAAAGAAQQVADQLAAKQALVTNQLAVAIAAERIGQAASAVATRAEAGGAVTDPSLPPFLQCVVQVESGGDYQAVSPNGLYMGAFQFSQSTWNLAAQLAGLPQLIGVPPNEASKADQDTLAVALWQADGSQPWTGDCGS